MIGPRYYLFTTLLAMAASTVNAVLASQISGVGAAICWFLSGAAAHGAFVQFVLFAYADSEGN